MASTREEKDGLWALLEKQAQEQPSPLVRDKQCDEFFKAMADLWRIADEHNLTNQIEFTNFILFGPQSAGKTTLTERILGFPVAVVKRDVGTTRPVVLTTRRSKEKGVWVKTSGSERYRKVESIKHVMNWASEQMRATGTVASTGVPRITRDRIYIDVSGPDLMNRRFVDLPGYQTNDEGTREAILQLLREEASRPNAVVVCVEDADLDYVNSHLIKAIHENQVFGRNFETRTDKSAQFLLALNKSDKWLGSKEITQDLLAAKLKSYLKGFGIMPIVVGGSVDPDLSSRDDFDAVVEQYSTANNRETQIYNSFFGRVSIGDGTRTRTLLTDRFLGFETFLGTVDAMVVSRDVRNFPRISQQLSNICDSLSQQTKNLQKKVDIIEGRDEDQDLQLRTNSFLNFLLTKLAEIATADSGRGGAQAGTSFDDIRTHGNNSFQEEMEFVLGRRFDSSPPSVNRASFGAGYYSPDRKYKATSADILHDKEAEDMWKKQIFQTINDLHKSVQSGNRNGLASAHASGSVISYITRPLIGGKVYERALAVWSGSVYKLLMPSSDDLDRMANVVGTNFEMNSPNDIDFKKPKRLAEIYIERLTPAIHFLCQKVEFLLLKMFDTAWRVVMKIDDHKTFVEAVGGDAFRFEVRRQFEASIRESAEDGYNKAFSDLRNEILKLLPYSADQASVSGMMYAFPDAASEIRDSKDAYDTDIAQVIKNKCKDYLSTLVPSGVSNALVEGIIFGIGVLADAASIDPLILAGVQLVKHIALGGTTNKRKTNRQRRDLEDQKLSEEEKDEWLLGVACSFYAHFLPRFVTTVDGRMRGDVWACVKDPGATEKIKNKVTKSKVLTNVVELVTKYETQIRELQTKQDELEAAKEQLETVIAEFPGSESAPPDEPLFPIDEPEEDEERVLKMVDQHDSRSSSNHDGGTVDEATADAGMTDVPSAFHVVGAVDGVNGKYVLQHGNFYKKDETCQLFLKELNDGSAKWLIGTMKDGAGWYHRGVEGTSATVPFDGWRDHNDNVVEGLLVFDAAANEW